MALRALVHHLPRNRISSCSFTSRRVGLGPSALLKEPSTVATPSSCRGFRNTSRVSASFLRFNPPSGEDLFKPHKWDLGTQITALVIGGGTVYYIYHLEKVPETGRWRFMDISPQEEHMRAKQEHQQLVAELEGNLLPHDHILTRHVRRVVSRILESSDLGRLKDEPARGGEETSGTPGDTWVDASAVERSRAEARHALPEREWHVLVVNDEKIANAMVLNGTVVVYTGILPLCQDENGLAAVLGHEIAHTVARHTSERLSSVKVLSFLAWIADAALGINFDLAQLVTAFALQLPNSRMQELEADKIGLALTAKACYDPRIVPEMQKRLAALEKALSGRMNIGFLRTHPSSEQRAQILESFLPDAYAVQAASAACAGMQDNLDAFRDAFSLNYASEPSNSIDSSEAWL